MKVNEFGRNFMAVILSLVVHTGLAAALLWQTNFTKLVTLESSNNTVPSKPNIEAVVVDQNLINAQAQKIREQRDAVKRKEEERLRKIERQAELMEKQREAEEQRLREIQAEKLAAEKAARDAELERERIVEEQRKMKEAIRIAEEKEKAAEAKRLAQLAEAKKAEEAAAKAKEAARKAEEEARKAAEAAQLAEKKRLDAAKSAEKERLEAERQLAEARRKKAEQEAALKELFSDLESESINRNSTREQQIQNEVAEWSDRYVSIITQKWRQNTTTQGQQCRLNLLLAADGFLVDVSKISGNDTVCDSAIRSVYSVNQFPMPEDPGVIKKLRNINLNFVGK